MVNLCCYPQNGKLKSLDICIAFAQGCNGRVIQDGQDRGGDAMFYGIDSHNQETWERVFYDSPATYWYSDNAFLDPTRGTHFRIAKNRLQHHGRGTSDCKRFDALGIPIKPWRKSGSFILICPQSDHFMRVAAHYSGSWLADTLAKLRTVTDRELCIRPWNRNKKQAYAELPEALKDCWCVVTYSSASAITAILSGVPAIATGDCIVSPMCDTLESIEDPMMSERRTWAGVLADQQWTLEEFRSGQCWSRLNAS